MLSTIQKPLANNKNVFIYVVVCKRLHNLEYGDVSDDVIVTDHLEITRIQDFILICELKQIHLDLPISLYKSY